MRRFGFALVLAALFLDGATAPARAQSDEDKDRLRAELVKQLDARIRKFRAEMVEEIDRALGTKPPAKPDRPVRPDRPAKPEKGEPGFLGVAVRELKPGMRELLGVPAGAGLLVDEVVPGSAAQAAGLRRTDVLMTWNGEKLTSEADLAKLSGAARAGDKVSLGIIRDSKPLTVEAKLLGKDERTETGARPPGGDMQKMLEDALRSGQIPGDPEQIKKMLEQFQGNPDMQKMLEGAMKQFEEMMKNPESRKQIEEMMKQFFGGDGGADEMQKRLQDMLNPGGAKPEAGKPEPKKDDIDRMLDDLLGQGKGSEKPADKPAAEKKPGPGYLGISIAPLDEATRTQLGLAAGEGLQVDSVVEGSPAAKAGILANDIVVALDGAVVGAPADLQKAVAGKLAGTKVSIVVLRKAERKTIEATLGDRPTEQAWK